MLVETFVEIPTCTGFGMESHRNHPEDMDTTTGTTRQTPKRTSGTTASQEPETNFQLLTHNSSFLDRTLINRKYIFTELSFLNLRSIV